jgi:endonuclease YncB( thermonuclease family)
MSRRKLISKRYSSLLSLLVVLVLLLGQHYHWFDKVQKAAETTQPGLYHVVEFVDGDTIAVDMAGTKETLRFIGVDTPETHDPRKAVQCFGAAAANFTKNLIGRNDVRLASDPLSTNRDRYDRLLRYVYLPDGTLVNAEIIKQGYGFAYLGFPFTKSDEFHQYELDARKNNLGLWKNCTPTQKQYGGFTSNNAQ